MARRRNNGGTGSGPAGECVKLEDRLVLAARLNSLPGYKTNRDLPADMKDVQEGFDPYGQGFIRHR